MAEALLERHPTKIRTERRQAVKELKIKDGDFTRFRDFFYRKTGIHFDDSKRYFVDKRLIERMQVTGCKSFREYFSMMRFEAAGKEFQQLVNMMTVNETYFFREAHQFDCLVNDVLDELVRHHGAEHAIRIWSIPSSTGEEPYSIVLYLLEHWHRIDQIDVEMFASDIDTNVLNACREGIFNKRSLMHVPAAMLKKYFTPVGREKYQIEADLREAIEFKRMNITDPLESRTYRNFDVIFCRNMLIYFDDKARREAVEAMYDALNPGGFIFLGHSESMSRICSLFKVRKFGDVMAYQKPMDG